MSVDLEKRDRVLLITLNRPHARNAIDDATAIALCNALAAFESDDAADVAVVSGADGVFCAGADVKWLATWTPEALARYSYARSPARSPLGPMRMRLTKPTIAAIAGYALAGGMELALLCDLRVIESDAYVACPNRRWDTCLVDGGAVRLARLVGTSRALDIVMTGRKVDAGEAFSIGLVNRIAPPGGALATAEVLAREITRWPQQSVRADRRSIVAQADRDFDDALREEFARGSRAFARRAETPA